MEMQHRSASCVADGRAQSASDSTAVQIMPQGVGMGTSVWTGQARKLFFFGGRGGGI